MRARSCINGSWDLKVNREEPLAPPLHRYGAENWAVVRPTHPIHANLTIVHIDLLVIHEKCWTRASKLWSPAVSPFTPKGVSPRLVQVRALQEPEISASRHKEIALRKCFPHLSWWQHNKKHKTRAGEERRNVRLGMHGLSVEGERTALGQKQNTGMWEGMSSLPGLGVLSLVTCFQDPVMGKDWWGRLVVAGEAVADNADCGVRMHNGKEWNGTKEEPPWRLYSLVMSHHLSHS